MLTTLKKHWKKEYLLIALAVVCLILYYYRDQLSKNKSVKEILEYLPLIAGGIHALNFVTNLAK